MLTVDISNYNYNFFVADVHIHVIMDEDDVIAICNYLLHGTYPEGLTRDDKRSLRQKSNAFLCEAGRYCCNQLILG